MAMITLENRQKINKYWAADAIESVCDADSSRIIRSGGIMPARELMTIEKCEELYLATLD